MRVSTGGHTRQLAHGLQYIALAIHGASKKPVAAISPAWQRRAVWKLLSAILCVYHGGFFYTAPKHG